MTAEILFVSGFAGAIAGGIVNLIAMYITRRWDREDKHYELKRALYSKIISFGAQAHHDGNFEDVSKLVNSALLVSRPDLHIALCELMSEILKIKDGEGNGQQLAERQALVTELMRKELDI